jgi:endonuclease/exonuclease/phosphatase family metal-dependent hydrolase
MKVGLLANLVLLLFIFWWYFNRPKKSIQIRTTIHPSDNSYRIASFNVCGIATTPSMMSSVKDCIEKLRRSCDIIVLQEVFFPWVRSYVKSGLVGWFVAEMNSNKFGLTGGVIITSRYKITDVKTIPFDNSYGPDSSVPKGVLSVKILGPWDLHLLGIHLQDNDWDNCGTIRKSQLTQIKNNIRNENDTIIVGDFNIDALKEKKLLKFAVKCLGPAITPSKYTHKKQILDYAFTRLSGFAEVLPLAEKCSDHSVVKIEILKNWMSQESKKR